MVSRSAALRSGSQYVGEKPPDLVDDRTMRDYLAVWCKLIEYLRLLTDNVLESNFPTTTSAAYGLS